MGFFVFTPTPNSAQILKEKNKTVVEFTLPENNKTIFAKEYKLYLPGKNELRKQLE